MEYDPLLAKLAVWAATREHATARMMRALGEYDVGGIRTNLAFFRQILEDAEFRAAKLHTGFIDEFFPRRSAAMSLRQIWLRWLRWWRRFTARGASRRPAMERAQAASPWQTAGRDGLLR